MIQTRIVQAPSWLAQDEAEEYCRQAASALQPFVGIKHPHIRQLMSASAEANRLTLGYESCIGSPISTVLQQVGCLTAEGTGAIVREVARALDCLAQNGLSHGSLNSDTIYIQPRGTIILADAGVARSLRSFKMAGVVSMFAANEHRNDVVALASLACELMTGLRPDPRIPTLSYWSGKISAEHAYILKRGLRSGYRSAGEFAEVFAPSSRTSMLRVVWQPAAMLGISVALFTVGGHASSEQKTVVHQPSHVVATASVPSPVQATASHVEQAMVVETPKLSMENMTEDDVAYLRATVRRSGIAALTQPYVAEVFQLTLEQREQIALCLSDQRNRVTMVIQEFSNGGVNDTRSAMNSIREDTRVRILLLLDEKQRRNWEISENLPSSSSVSTL